ncbi:MAG TPA: hypothetical protein VK614_03850 [Allosphingosinicella sp.]|nr:hypothetical protein [Allosphingosinicella sp.]
MKKRIRVLNSFALAIVVGYTGLASSFIAKQTVVDPFIDAAFVFLTSVGFYHIVIDIIYTAVGSIRPLLFLYWGKEYVDGLWAYSYTIEGDTTNTIYFGLWRFEQDLYETKVIGFGLSDEFTARSRVRSVSDIMRDGSQCEFLNIRSDSVEPSGDYYSRTLMYFEFSRRFLFKYPVRMRGKTVMYGGPRNGLVTNNYFIRHPKARTEQDVIDELRASFETSGVIHPEARRQKAPQ